MSEFVIVCCRKTSPVYKRGLHLRHIEFAPKYRNIRAERVLLYSLYREKILVTPHIHICKMAPVLKIPLQHVLKLHVGYPYLLHRACVYQWKCLVRPYNIVRI